MPVKALLFFILHKYKEDVRREQYLFDVLWAVATDVRFKDKQNKPTLPRWKALKSAACVQKQNEPTAEEILNIMLRRG